MSWNIITRLNNLQQQVNNIANTGLTNPLEETLNANSFNMINLDTLDANANILKLQSSNVGGIQTNCKLDVDGEVTCTTLNYTTLNPPITGGGENLEQTLTNGNDAGGLNMVNLGSVTLSTLNYTTLNPPIAPGGENLEQTLTNGDTANELNIINVGTLQASVVNYGTLIKGINPTFTFTGGATQNSNNVVCPGQTISSFASTTSYLNPSISVSPVNFNDGAGYIRFGLSTDGTSANYGIFWYGPGPSMYIIDNGVQGASISAPIASTEVSLVLTDGVLNVYVNGNLESALTINVPSGNYYFYGLASQYFETTFTNLAFWYGNTSDTVPNLTQVLTSGNNGGGNNITNLGAVTVSTLNYTTLNPPITGGGENLEQTLTNGNNANNLNITGLNNLSLVSMTLPDNELYETGTNLTLTKDGMGTNGTIFDSYYNAPIPRAVKILNNNTFSVTNLLALTNKIIFTLPLDTYYINKINYARVDSWDLGCTANTNTIVNLFLTDNPAIEFSAESTTYTNLSLNLVNGDGFRNTTGLFMTFTSPTPFSTIYLCANSVEALTNFSVNISGEMNFGVNVPTITANPT